MNNVNSNSTPSRQQALQSQAPKSTHRRQESRPFDVLYQGAHSASLPASQTLNQNLENYKTASYIEIEEAIRTGRNMANKSSSANTTPPVVTRVDHTPRRSGSLVSDSPILRRRNTFKSRNRMQKRQALPPPENSSSSVFSGHSKAKKAGRKRSRLSFVFPIKRRTSYKYFPASRANPKDNKFNSQREIDEYFLNDNVLALIKDVVPRTMAVFEYKNLTHMVPDLISSPRQFAISRDAKFTMLEQKLSTTAIEKFPFQGEKVVNSVPQRYGKQYPDTIQSENSLDAKRRNFLKAVNIKYRAAVFSNGGRIPPKVEEALPFEGEMMTKEEKERMNTSVLFELLMRRTVAAKIDFRLKRSGVSIPNKSRKKSGSSGSPSKRSSNSSSSFGPSSRKQRQAENNRLSYNFDLPNENTSSINTDELMQHNASLLSELLPSPQISFTSNILGMGEFPTNNQHRFLKSTSNTSENLSKAKTSESSLDHNMAHGRDFQEQKSSYNPWNYKFIYDISKLDLAPKNRHRPTSSHLGNVKDTSLRPLKGSNHTISSISVRSAENLAFYDSTATSSAYVSLKRNSDSTGQTTRYTENSALSNRGNPSHTQSFDRPQIVDKSNEIVPDSAQMVQI